MSRLYEALRKSEEENEQRDRVAAVAAPEPSSPPVAEPVPQPINLEAAQSVRIRPGPETRLVALTDERSLGAEEFRVLATRLMNLCAKRELKSVQLMSSVTGEGKTLVSVNLATTLARRYRRRVLLVEGDMRRPGLQRLFGSAGLKGIAQWWVEKDGSLPSYLCRLPDLSLWFLPSGGPCEQPTDILQSARLGEAFRQLVEPFDWVVVDSTPTLQIADANLWARLVDGSLMVVREGLTPVNGLKKGLAGMDNPKLIGVVLNQASEFSRRSYYENHRMKPEPGANGQPQRLKEEPKVRSGS